MPKIIELRQHIADLIAAGEVVQRPASVVKELMENSIDSGAGIVTVEISSGGMTYIRVTDNGCGIAPEDAKTAFLRHATSKLQSAEGLEAIETLGFRGEALAAIAAVSRIELLTRVPGADEGVALTLEAGKVTDMSPAGCPEGTTIIVRDLFFNTPARLKFMKSDRAEGGSIASVVLRCALSRPDVSVRFIKDGKTEYHTPGDSRIDSCIYSLLGREIEAGFLSAESSDEAVAVEGFVSKPAAARGNRSYQFFFVNGRVVRSLLLQSALEQAYKNTLPSGKFPSCVLYITTKPNAVDVNVHPAKTEIKFFSDKQIYDGVYYAALGVLNNLQVAGNKEQASEGLPPLISQTNRHGHSGAYANPAQQSLTEMQSGKGGGFKTMQADEFRSSYVSESSKAYASRDHLPGNLHNHAHDNNYAHSHAVHADPAIQPQTSLSASATGTVGDIASNESSEAYNLLSDADPHIYPPSFRLIGEALNVYIILEYQESVWFIDKHAAHERLHFDALKSDDYEPMSEALLTPVICRLGHEDTSLLLENADLMDSLGFSIDSFGEDSVAVRHIPADIDISDTESVVSDICRQLGQRGIAESSQIDGIFKTIACRAAIKAGQSSDSRELILLAEKVMSGEVSLCPHGRPVAFEVTKTTLDKGFGRA